MAATMQINTNAIVLGVTKPGCRYGDSPSEASSFSQLVGTICVKFATVCLEIFLGEKNTVRPTVSGHPEMSMSQGIRTTVSALALTTDML